jgi:mannose-6-phosphate isomerase-like protein (cupin superfamily)
MHAFEISDLIKTGIQSGSPYLEFMRVPTLSTGVYLLSAGASDEQEPHTEDEVYYVIQGRGTIRVGNEDRPVEAGSVIFVAAKVEHRFHSINEDMVILVFFAPAEYSNA